MGLAEFMQKIQEQDDNDVIFSKEPEQTIKIIPPEAPSGIKVIPPENIIEQPRPTKIKFKIQNKDILVDNNTSQLKSTQTNVQQNIESVKQEEITPQQSTTTETTKVSVQPEQQISQPIKEQPVQPKPLSKEEEEEIIFMKTGTELSKKQLWIEYYRKAKASRKQNPVADRMREGKFTITYDNKVLILPDYDVVNKDPDDILKEHWF